MSENKTYLKPGNVERSVLITVTKDFGEYKKGDRVVVQKGVVGPGEWMLTVAEIVKAERVCRGWRVVAKV